MQLSLMQNEISDQQLKSVTNIHLKNYSQFSLLLHLTPFLSEGSQNIPCNVSVTELWFIEINTGRSYTKLQSKVKSLSFLHKSSPLVFQFSFRSASSLLILESLLKILFLRCKRFNYSCNDFFCWFPFVAGKWIWKISMAAMCIMCLKLTHNLVSCKLESRKLTDIGSLSWGRQGCLGSGSLVGCIWTLRARGEWKLLLLELWSWRQLALARIRVQQLEKIEYNPKP